MFTSDRQLCMQANNKRTFCCLVGATLSLCYCLYNFVCSCVVLQLYTGVEEEGEEEEGGKIRKMLAKEVGP